MDKQVLAFELMGLNRGQLLKWIPLRYIDKKRNLLHKYVNYFVSIFKEKSKKNLNENDFLDENLFENQLFLVGDKPITKMRRQHLGDFQNCRIRDIWNQDNKSVKSRTELEQQYNTVLPNMLYNQIYSTTYTVYKN